MERRAPGGDGRPRARAAGWVRPSAAWGRILCARSASPAGSRHWPTKGDTRPPAPRTCQALSRVQLTILAPHVTRSSNAESRSGSSADSSNRRAGRAAWPSLEMGRSWRGSSTLGCAASFGDCYQATTRSDRVTRVDSPVSRSRQSGGTGNYRSVAAWRVRRARTQGHEPLRDAFLRRLAGARQSRVRDS